MINFQIEGYYMKFLSDSAFKANVVNLIYQSEIVIVSIENYAWSLKWSFHSFFFLSFYQLSIFYVFLTKCQKFYFKITELFRFAILTSTTNIYWWSTWQAGTAPSPSLCVTSAQRYSRMWTLWTVIFVQVRQYTYRITHKWADVNDRR